MIKLRFLFFIMALFLLGSCTIFPRQKDINEKWSLETRIFYENLKVLSEEAILIGHEDALAYGVDWWGVQDHSDIKAVSGYHPAVYGWDIGHIFEKRNIDSVSFKKMHQYIKRVYQNGGINTISWHLKNPLNEASSWDTTRTIEHILPGGKAHSQYLKQLDQAALFLKKCKYKGKAIPIIFRPFHEHNGSWFWWGKHLSTEEEYVQLFRFTIDYLRKKKNLNHLIIAFSPDRSKMAHSSSQEEYLYGYPGDEYVDIIGLDNYWDVGKSGNQLPPNEQVKHYQNSLELIVQLAKEKGKIAALTETGLEGVPHSKWFTEHILSPIKQSELAPKIAYILFWRNANTQHHYIPFPGHTAQSDFLEFLNDSMTYLDKDLPNLYTKRINLK